MASTTFSPGTVIASTWLNAVNVAVYNTLPTLAPLVSPNFSTPSLGVATATSLNKNTFTQPANGNVWSLSDGKTFTVNNTVTINGTDGAVLTLGTGTNTFSGTFSGTSSGTNTGDQLAFKTFKVSGQPDVVATGLSDSLTLVGGTGVSFTTDATSKTITLNSGSALQLLGTATIPNGTTPANIDFLNVFSSTYTKYIVVAEVCSNFTGYFLGMQMAVNGTAVATASYINRTLASPESTVALTSMEAYHLITPGQASYNNNINIIMEIGPISSSTYYCTRGTYVPLSATTSRQGIFRTGSFEGGTPSGFRLLMINAGTFSTGTVRVYGLKNT